MSEIAHRTPAYRPIEDYGVIGNLSSVALVRLDGCIDWCCLPFLDSPSVFAAILDATRGGFFLLQPPSFTHSSQEYVEGTNILKTHFRIGGGRVEICDFMPTGPSVDRDSESPEHMELYRKVRCTHGQVDVDVLWTPRHDYARGETRIKPTSNGFVALYTDHSFGLAGLDDGRIVEVDDGGPAVAGRISLRQGEETFLLNRWGEVDPHLDPDEAERKLRQTTDAWTKWVSKPKTGLERPWAGRWADQVRRSELFLKLMTERSGALAAAPTTSLPETLGGIRNWDYRYTWIRDAAQIGQAFLAVDHDDEAWAFVRWAEKMACEGDDVRGEGLQVMYPLRPETGIDEQTLDHLEGYKKSGPVRIGNSAHHQLQLDAFGEVLNAVYEKSRLSESDDLDLEGFLSHLVDEMRRAWHHPDFGIWELQNGPLHLVYSRLMTWVGFDRACRLREMGHLDGDVEAWRRTMERIREQILRHGYHDEIGSFVRSFRSDDLDAANLLIPMMEFLPYDDPRVQNTIDTSMERLMVNDLVFRYDGDDGLPGDEGAFALCTLWLVDALALSHRLDEANRIFEGLMGRTNHLGLLSEQIDPYSGEFLGNFPQAYSHLGIINSALYLAEREGRELPIESLLGARGL